MPSRSSRHIEVLLQEVPLVLSSDSGSGSETPEVLTASIPVTDSDTNSESAVLSTVQIASNDSASSSETSAEVVALSSTDAGVVPSGGGFGTDPFGTQVFGDSSDGETSALAASYVQTDVGTDSESNVSSAQISSSDVGSDSETVATTVYAADSATASEVAAIVAVLSDSDTGTSNEVGTPHGAYALTDVGSGSDVSTAAAKITSSDVGRVLPGGFGEDPFGTVPFGADGESFTLTATLASGDSGTDSEVGTYPVSADIVAIYAIDVPDVAQLFATYNIRIRAYCPLTAVYNIGDAAATAIIVKIVTETSLDEDEMSAILVGR